MKIVVAGKGGSGKTTVSGTIARELARRDHKDRAIARADEQGLAPIDLDREAPGVKALLELAERVGRLPVAA